MDLDYLARLEDGCQPDGSLVTYVYRYTDGPDVGEIGLYQVELRGDDALELIRLAKERLVVHDQEITARAERVARGLEAIHEYEEEHGEITEDEMRQAEAEFNGS